jgi:hypothetical protein
MAEYLAEVQRIEKFFDGFEFDMSHGWTIEMPII